MKKIISVFLLLVSVVFHQKSLVNTANLDHLYQEIKVNNLSLGIIHIYRLFLMETAVAYAAARLF